MNLSPTFSPVVRRREDQLAGQREARRVPRHVAPQVELARHRAHRVVRRPRRHLQVGSKIVIYHKIYHLSSIHRKTN